MQTVLMFYFQDYLKLTSEWKHIISLLEKKSKSDVDNQSKYYEVLHGKQFNTLIFYLVFIFIYVTFCFFF